MNKYKLHQVEISFFLGFAHHWSDVVLLVQVLFFGDLLLLVLFERIYGISFEVLSGQWLFQLLLFHFVFLCLDQKLTWILGYS